MDKATIGTWEDLLDVDDTEYTTVPVGSKTVRLGSLSAAEMIIWFDDQEDEEKKKLNGLRLVAKCLVDDKGARYGKLDDIIKLRSKQPATVKRLVKACMDLNDLSVKVETKNDSGETVPSASPIDTALPSA